MFVESIKKRERVRQALRRDAHSHRQENPGLRKYEVSRGPIATPNGASGIHLIATLHFDDIAAIQRAFASPEGQAAAADVRTFATGGVDMLIFDSHEV